MSKANTIIRSNAAIKIKKIKIKKDFIMGALDNNLKFSVRLHFIYEIKADCLFTNAKRTIQNFLLKVKKSLIVFKWG